MPTRPTIVAGTAAAWLEALGLGRYAAAFAAHQIDLDVLPQLTDADLKELGVAALGHRKKLLAGIAALAGAAAPAPAPAAPTPLAYTPQHLADRIRRDRGLLEGERKLVTVLFADIQGSMELLAGMDPESARQVLGPVTDVMMRAVHRYEGTVNKILGDGIMAVFGAPIAHEDHALRACYAALAVQEGMQQLAAQLRAAVGVEPSVRIGLNSGEVVVGSISNDLSVEYDAIGPTVHLAARMEQLARPGTTRLTAATAQLVEGFCRLVPLGPVPVKGMGEPHEVFELAGVTSARGRLQAATVRGFTRFVGRAAEMDVLAAALQRAGEGHGQLVAVVGEPGVGKSRLCHQLVQSAAARGWRALEGGAVSHGRATAYLPLIDLLRAYFDVAPGDEPPRTRERVRRRLVGLDERLHALATPLLALLDVPVDDAAWQTGEPARRRALTIDAVRTLVVREAAERPVVLVVEDLHWADGETLAVLDALVEALPRGRILMLLNSRPEFAERWSATPGFTRVALHPLPPLGAEALLDDLLGDAPPLAALKRSLIERATGNPLFLEECVRALVEQGALAGEKGRRRLVQAAAPNLLPASVQAVLASRIDRLDGEAKRVLQTASVIGKDFDLPLLAAVVDAPDESRLAAALSILRASEFVYETRLFPEAHYTFAHALTHEVALGGLLLTRRTELHGRVVAAIERLHPTRLFEHVDSLALHATRGQVWNKAYAYGRQAGERAAARSAPHEAVTQFEQALAALAHLPADRERDAAEIALRLALRDELFVLGGEDDALAAHVDAAVRLARAMGDSAELSSALLQLGGVEWQRGRHRESLAHARQSLAIATALGHDTLSALGRYRCGIALVMLGDMQAAAEMLDASLRHFDSDAGRREFHLGGSPFSFAASFRALALGELGRFDEAERIGERGLANARALRQPYTITVSCFGLAHACIRRGAMRRALDVLTLAEEQFASHGVLVTAYWAATRLALAAAAVGETERARAAIRLVEEQRRHQPSSDDVFNLVFVADAARLLGDADAARRYADLAVERGRIQEEENAVAHGLVIRARLALDGGAAAAAAAALDAAAAIAARRGYRPLAAACELLRARVAGATAGEDAARPRFAAAAETARRLGMEALALEAATAALPPARSS